jgi:hypothetical protein
MWKLAVGFLAVGLLQADTISLSTSASANGGVNGGQAGSTVSATFDLNTAVTPSPAYYGYDYYGIPGIAVELVSINFNAPQGTAYCPDVTRMGQCDFEDYGSFTLASGGVTYEAAEYGVYAYDGTGGISSCTGGGSICDGGYFPLGEYTITLSAAASVTDLTVNAGPQDAAFQSASITLTYTNSPEPGTWMLCGAGLITCGVSARRRKVLALY